MRIIRKLQPEGAHYGHSSQRSLAYGAVEIKKHAVPQFQILSADALHLRIVQLTRIWHSGAIVISDLGRSRVSRVPAPGKSQSPRSPMRSKQSAKGAELEPAQKNLRGEFASGNE